MLLGGGGTEVGANHRNAFRAIHSPVASAPLVSSDRVSPEGVIPKDFALAFHRYPRQVNQVPVGFKVLPTLRVTEVGGADDDMVAVD